MTTSSIAAGVQYLSHASLIENVAAPAGSPARIDAIIVPAARPARHLLTAIGLAKEADCHLVVLCSLRTRPDQVRQLFEARRFTKGIAVDVPLGHALPDLGLETDAWVRRGSGKDVCGGRKSDLSVKRNIGLLTARMLGWRHVFFMDDDIRGMSRQDLVRTVSLLGPDGAGYRSAGIRVKYFPDNSVVCHARRVAGDPQDVFVSGAVLAVDCTQPFTFFPDLYNEDWLFFYPDVAGGKMASPGLLATKMQQVAYHPFADPGRAARQEFGDVIAEGLYSLLHNTTAAAALGIASTPRYWSQFLDTRKIILKDIDHRAESRPMKLRTVIADAIESARQVLDQITPYICTDYIETWQRDLKTWAQKRDSLPGAKDTSAALRQLGLTL